VFVSVFSWSYRKGYDVLLEAFFRAFTRSENVSLRIVSSVPDFVGGDKNITNRIEDFKKEMCAANVRMCAAAGELPEVTWYGNKVLSRPEIRHVLGSSDAFALASRGEGWGLPVAEAMSMALPVVVPNHTGLSAFCHGDTSYLVPVDESQKDRAGFPRLSVDAFSEALKNVVKDARSTGRAQAIGRAARQRMKERWSPEGVVSLIAERVVHLSKVKRWH